MITDGILTSSLSGSLPGASTTGASSSSADKFQQAFARATERVESGQSPLLNSLLGLNNDSTRLAGHAERAAQTEMRPSELMMLTMRSHEFLFHCELVSNVANRSSDGVQQLFRQQS
jgi:hypothetical protein